MDELLKNCMKKHTVSTAEELVSAIDNQTSIHSGHVVAHNVEPLFNNRNI